MKRLFIWLLWGLVIAGLALAADQTLLHTTANSPIFGAAQTFYQDFRGRLILLARKGEFRTETREKGWSPSLAPGEKIKEKVRPTPLPPPRPETGGYVYIDKNGGLHLATSLDEVPRDYRAAARPLQK